MSVSRRGFLKGVAPAIPVLLFGRLVKSRERLVVEPVTDGGMWSNNLGTAEPLSMESLEKAIEAIGGF